MTMTGMPPQTVEEIIALLKLQYEFARTGQGWDEYAAAREKACRPDGKTRRTRFQEHRITLTGNSYDGCTSTILFRRFVSSRCRRSRSWGELDNNIVAEKNKAAWEAALKAAGNRDYTLRILPKANHGQFEAKVGSNAEPNRCSDSCRLLHDHPGLARETRRTVSKRRSSLRETRYPLSAISGSTRVARRAGK